MPASDFVLNGQPLRLLLQLTVTVEPATTLVIVRIFGHDLAPLKDHW